MIDTETKIMFLIFIILLFFSSYKYTIIFTIFWIFVYLFGFFLTSLGLDVDNRNIENSEIFYQEYTGDYNLLYEKLREYNEIKRKFKLSTEKFSPFGIFYDNPDINDPSKCRAVYGIIKLVEDDYKDLKQYLKSQNYKCNTLPKTDCIVGEYSSLFNVQNSFIFISKLIISMTNLKFFRRLFHPKWKENKIKTARKNYNKHSGVIFMIKPSKVEIYIPIQNTQDFFLHSELQNPPKSTKK